MPLFQSKVVRVEAWLFGHDVSPNHFPDFIKEGIRKKELTYIEADNGLVYFSIDTPEGVTRAHPGEHYIVKGVEGEFYPCRVSIFLAKYEPIA